MRAIDTNVLIRLMVRDDPNQVATAQAFIGPGAWVSHLVLMEAVWVMQSSYGIEPEQAMSAIEGLLENEAVTVQDADVVKRAVENAVRHPSVGFSDSLILEVARKAGHLPLGTFDRVLGKLGGAQRL